MKSARHPKGSGNGDMRQADRTLKRLLMCRAPEIFYLPITKSGSTFVKNVLWTIERGEVHPDPLRIHRDGSLFQRASESGVTLAQVRRSETAFVVLRDPVSRFLSLYFDKVVGAGATRFVTLRDHLIGEYELRPETSTSDDHQWNTRALARFLELNLKGAPGLRKNPHWRPQSGRSGIMSAGNLKVVVAEELDSQISNMLRPVFPGIDEILGAAERNRSISQGDRSEFLGSEALQLIGEIYNQDALLHRSALNLWRATGRVPRFSDVRAQRM